MQGSDDHHWDDGDQGHHPAERKAALRLLRCSLTGRQSVDVADGEWPYNGASQQGEADEQEKEPEGLLKQRVQHGQVEADGDPLRCDGSQMA
jgi:hypothetical protein